MSRRDNHYSRVIAWLRVILPLAALALLSTMFLLSRNVDPTKNIPFSEIDLEERARDQQVTSPNLAGATLRGDLIAFSAETARPDPDDTSRYLASNLTTRIDLIGGTKITFASTRGIVDEGADDLRLVGDVVITSSTGYRVTTDELHSGLREIRAETPGPVRAVGPPGTFSAGRMQLTRDPETGNIHLLFTNGVNLIYDPRE